MTTTTGQPEPNGRPATAGAVLGYARVSTASQSLDQQADALTAAGVDSARIYADQLSGSLRASQRAGMTALLDYARPGDVIVVVGIDRLGRDAAEVMLTIRELTQQGIVLRSLREGIDTGNATGRMVAGVLASLAELELELGRERRAAARDARARRGQPTGRPRALDRAKRDQVLALAAAGEPVAAIAETFGVGRDTVYRVIRAARDSEHGTETQAAQQDSDTTARRGNAEHDSGGE